MNSKKSGFMDKDAITEAFMILPLIDLSLTLAMKRVNSSTLVRG